MSGTPRCCNTLRSTPLGNLDPVIRLFEGIFLTASANLIRNREFHVDYLGHAHRFPRWLHRLGAMDQLVEWIKPKRAPKWMTDDEYAKLPEHLIVRQLRYQVGRPGFRTKEVT